MLILLQSWVNYKRGDKESISLYLLVRYFIFRRRIVKVLCLKQPKWTHDKRQRSTCICLMCNSLRAKKIFKACKMHCISVPNFRSKLILSISMRISMRSLVTVVLKCFDFRLIFFNYAFTGNYRLYIGIYAYNFFIWFLHKI